MEALQAAEKKLQQNDTSKTKTIDQTEHNVSAKSTYECMYVMYVIHKIMSKVHINYCYCHIHSINKAS